MIGRQQDLPAHSDDDLLPRAPLLSSDHVSYGSSAYLRITSPPVAAELC